MVWSSLPCASGDSVYSEVFVVNCAVNQWYIPVTGVSGSAIFTCNTPDGYMLAESQCCVQNLVNQNSCNAVDWNGNCSVEYDECAGLCGDSSASNYSPEAICLNEFVCYVSGCTNDAYPNYNAEATVDDGSCEFIYGCTYILAPNYNSEATFDDGSCELPDAATCPGDFTGDGVITVADITGFLSAFGSVCD